MKGTNLCFVVEKGRGRKSASGNCEKKFFWIRKTFLDSKNFFELEKPFWKNFFGLEKLFWIGKTFLDWKNFFGLKKLFWIRKTFLD